MVRIRWSRIGIIILVTGLGLNWLTPPVLAEKEVAVQTADIKNTAVIAAEQDFICRQEVSDDELLQTGRLFQIEYRSRWQIIHAEFDRGVEEGERLGEEKIEVDFTKLAETESRFFIMGVHHGYDSDNRKAEPTNVQANTEISEDNASQAATQPINDTSSTKTGEGAAVITPPMQPQTQPELVVSPLPRGVATLGHQKFIQQFASTAQVVAQEHNLYASVMIAQAVLESSWGTSTLSQAPVYNLFGIKGAFAGQSVTMKTNEDDGQGRLFTIAGQFRRYPSYHAGLDDYAGVLLQPIFAKAWKSNTTSYKDATAALTGTYATDISYGAKLNQIIETYDLTQYDQNTSRLDQPHMLKHNLKQPDTLVEKEQQPTKPITHKLEAKITAIIGWIGVGSCGLWLAVKKCIYKRD